MRWAVDHKGKWLDAHHFQDNKDLTRLLCPECKAVLHYRAPYNRQAHFFHKPSATCQYGLISQKHLFLQGKLEGLLDECILEYPIASRIADVAWIKEKIVFEVQVSPISWEDLCARSRDYWSEDWHVVWFLDEEEFFKPKYSHWWPILQTIPYLFFSVHKEELIVRNFEKQICFFEELTQIKKINNREKRIFLQKKADKTLFPILTGLINKK